MTQTVARYVHAYVSRELETQRLERCSEDEEELAKPMQPAKSCSNEHCCRAFRTLHTYTLTLFPFLAS